MLFPSVSERLGKLPLLPPPVSAIHGSPQATEGSRSAGSLVGSKGCTEAAMAAVTSGVHRNY